MVGAATAITAAVTCTRGDVAFGLVIVWAFAGIAVKHAGTPLVAPAAWVATAAAAVVTALGVWTHRPGKLSPAAAS